MKPSDFQIGDLVEVIQDPKEDWTRQYRGLIGTVKGVRGGVVTVDHGKGLNGMNWDEGIVHFLKKLPSIYPIHFTISVKSRNEDPENISDDWKTWRNSSVQSGECVCGIQRERCDYHR